MSEDFNEENRETASGCGGNCSSCASACSSRNNPQSFLEEQNPYSNISRIIGVVSGKGGVGKSFVSAYLAVLMRRKKYSTAILDADITGPSIPKAFGINRHAGSTEIGILPEKSEGGIGMMSVNLLLEDQETPVVWRGAIISGTVKQFYTDVVWGDVDYMFVDMPPGTGDVPLTVFQSLPVDGIVVVTSPQDVVSMVVKKAMNMAKLMKVPVLGIVENYSYLECPDCGKKISVFGESHVDEIAAQYGIPVLARIPIDPAIAASVDAGSVEKLEGGWLDEAADTIERELPIEM
ncbi:MAG: Mrp/NBP35 family ATP-binding protein [Lachnospiraceae bacterium]|nr:Mrp/NBP35 family ATP-binding protein [Lachnospiraceae bacterium]